MSPPPLCNTLGGGVTIVSPPPPLCNTLGGVTIVSPPPVQYFWGG